MKTTHHHSATSSHYNDDAEHYDAFNEKNSRVINRTIADVLKKFAVHSVIDLTCGTGSQVFWLTKKGFHVVGCDINNKMLKQAKSSAKKLDQEISFHRRDMRSARIGKFDAAITIFNSIGHLTKADFAIALGNIRENLTPDGFYLFDIFNLDFLRHKNNITTFTIDWFNANARLIQYSTIDDDGIMASFTTTYEETKNGGQKKYHSEQTLQVYSAQQLRDLLRQHGFRVVSQTGVDGSPFTKYKTDRILTLAQKTMR